MDEDFEKYIKLLRESYLIEPKNTLAEMKYCLKRLKVSSDSSSSLALNISQAFKDIDMSLFLLVVIIIFIGLVGFFQIKNIIMYLFGLVFFLTGLEIGLKQKGIGLIFLVSHGGTGFGVMLASLVGNYIASPLFTDLSLKVYVYLGIMFIVGIMALGIILLSNLSDSFKQQKYVFHVVLLFFLVIFLMAGMMPHILGG